ncbi:MAG: SDR family oxidoreductase, partial [Chloroflexota bacterium]
GLGSATCLARAGFRLVICARSPDTLSSAAGGLRELGAEVEAVPADVSDRGQLESVFASADRVFGRLDVLVANSGGPPPGGFMEVDDDRWEGTFRLTLMSAIRAMRLAVARMRSAGYGRIIMIGSSSVKQPIENLVLSNTFRPALLGVVKTLSREVAADGITVNMVSPGRINSDRVRAVDESRAQRQGVTIEEIRRATERDIPAGRYGEPEELGALVAFLASESAAYITGQSIIVDGGMVSAL